MSTAVYNQIWRDAQKKVTVLLARDAKLTKKERETEKQVSLRWMLRLYAEYIDIVKRLDESYDQIVQPQKRILIRKILEGCIGRLLELKNELLVELEKSNYSYFDDLLIERGLTYEDLEITSPRCFYRDREIELAERRIFIQEMIQAACKEVEEQSEELEKLEKALEKQLKKKEEAKLDPTNPASKLIEQEELVTDPMELKRRRFQADHIRALADAGAGFPEPGPKGIPIDAKVAEAAGVVIPKPKTLATVEEVSEAILIVQTHERARQNRRELYNRQAAIAKSKHDSGSDRSSRRRRIKTPVPLDSKALAAIIERNHAARVIQRAWRGHIAKRHDIDKQLDEDIVLGIVPKPYIDYSYRDRLYAVQALRRIRQREMQKVYEEMIVKEIDFVDHFLTPQFFEDIGDEMREWIRVWYYLILKMPKYPEEGEVKLKSKLLGLPKGTPDDMFPEIEPEIPGLKTRMLGGSNLITAGFWVSAKQFFQAQEVIAKQKGKKEKKAKLTKEEKKEARLKAKQVKKAEKERLLAEKRRGFKLDPSNVMPALKVADREYKKEWEFLRPDEENPEDEPYVDLIRVEETYKQQNEVRKAVDELMRAELELLLDAEWREKMKHKKKKKPRKKPKAKKKGKKGKKGKKKKKDPTKDRTTEELLAELARAGIVRNYRYANMDEYIGEPGYAHFEQRQEFKDPLPTWADIRQVIREFCILPLGNERVHELAPAGRSALIAGPPGVGKSLLVDILCTEVGALLIDLSVESVAGSYPGKKGMTMLMHLVNKVGRLLKPTVILLDNAHRTFYKKVPKEERFLEPKRMSKQMKKLVKGIKPGDQMMVVGTSNAPWLAKRGKFMKTFQRHIYVPPMDYGTRTFMWSKIIMEYKGVDRRFEATPLAQLTQWVTLDTMRTAVRTVMSVNRITELARQPLHHSEILAVLMEMPPEMQPPNPKERKKWEKFYTKLPLVKARKKVVEEWAKVAEKNAKNKKRK